MAWRFEDEGNPYPISIIEQRLISDQIPIPDIEYSNRTKRSN
jgi:hypothetical protein